MSQPDLARALFSATLERLDPADLVAGALGRCELSGDRVWVIALGKAALGMADGAHRVLGERLTGGLVVADQDGETPPSLPLAVGSHPTPDERSVAAGRAALDEIGKARAGDRVIALISGGASALVAVPAAGLSLADKAAAVDRVKAAGAPIQDLNVVRKHLSAIKGGRLARASAAPVVTLVLSDVVGDDLSSVGSGPTVPDPSTYRQACAIVERCGGWRGLPDAVRTHLEAGASGQRPETPKQARPGDHAVLVAGVATLAVAAREAAIAAGLEAEILAHDLADDVARVAARIAGEVRRARKLGRRQCLIAAGEPTIVVPEHPGRGGRAQQLALELAGHLRGTDGVTVLCAGSDGIDGNSSAAGGVVDGGTWRAVAASGLDPNQVLARCDASTALRAVGAAVTTGRTGLNHCDLILVLLE